MSVPTLLNLSHGSLQHAWYIHSTPPVRAVDLTLFQAGSKSVSVDLLKLKEPKDVTFLSEKPRC